MQPKLFTVVATVRYGHDLQIGISALPARQLRGEYRSRDRLRSGRSRLG